MRRIRYRRHHWQRRKWLAITGGIAAAVITAGAITVYQAELTARQRLPGFLQPRLSAALGREVKLGRVSPWPLGAVSLMGVEVTPTPEDHGAPLVADRIRAYPDWMALIFKHKLEVRELHIDGAHLRTVLDLRHPSTTHEDVTARLLSLYSTGLRRIVVHGATADVTTVLPNGGEQGMEARGLDVDTRLHPRRFDYDVHSATWSGAGLQARDIILAGNSDGRSLNLVKSGAKFAGGDLAANGTAVTSRGDVAMQVRVTNLPISNLAPQVGIPAEWAVKGEVTGTVQVNAASGALSSVDGNLHVAPGLIRHAHATLPWTSATAHVDWKPERTHLSNIAIEGQGLRIRGNANVDGRPDQKLASRPFHATGNVEATRADAVASLAELLAFSAQVPRNWSVGHASLNFASDGIVGHTQDASATGHFVADNASIQIRPKHAPLVVRRAEGDVERKGTHLAVKNLRMAADGLTASGNLELTSPKNIAGSRFAAKGHVDLTSLALLRQQVPDASLWRWIDPAAAGSHGTFTFAAQGPAAKPELASGTGSFRVSGFSVKAPQGTGDATWPVPVRDLSGSLRLADERMALTDVKLRSDLFSASGSGLVTDLLHTAQVSGTARISSSRWAELPPLKGRIPKGLSGGTMTVVLGAPPHTRLSKGPKQKPGSAETPLSGTVEIHGAAYTAPIAGVVRTTQLQDARAQFKLAGRHLDIPEYRLVTPQFATSGQGHGDAAGSGKWNLRAEGKLASGDAGALARWWANNDVLQGGKLAARYTLEVPTSGPYSVHSRIRLTDAQPHLSKTTLPFSPAEAKIDSLTGNFSMRDGHVRFSDAVWQAPRFTAKGDGVLKDRNIEGDFSLTTEKWREIAGDLVKTVPASGGELTLTGHVAGPAANVRDLPFRGTMALRGAHMTDGVGIPIQGGTLDMKAAASGTLAHAVAAGFNGSFMLRDATLKPFQPGTKPPVLALARGDFKRTGRTLELTNLAADTGGASLHGEGTITGLQTPQAEHRFHLTAEGASLATMLPAVMPLPGKATGGKFTASLDIRGSQKYPWHFMEGRGEVRSAEWIPPHQTQALKITRAAGHFVRNGATAKLDDVALKTPAGEASLNGTVTGLNTPAAARHHLKVAWRLEDASGWAARFFPIPGGFTGGTFTGTADVVGTRKQPAERASGKFEVKNAGYLAPAKILNGPTKPISVNWAKGIFTRANGKTQLEELDLNTSIGTATGRIAADDRGIADLKAHVVVAKLQNLIDLYPSFESRIKGGEGEMDMNLHGPLKQPKDLTGPVEVVGRNGSLMVADVKPEFAEEPFDEFRLSMNLTGGAAVRFDQVKMRGPKANLDGEGEVSASGKVYGKGEAWFTEKFTKSLVKPKFLWPIAKLFGFKKVKSKYTVDGSLHEAFLHMSITKSTMYKLAIRKEVPESLRKIATGEAPLWVSSTVPPPRTASR